MFTRLGVRATSVARMGKRTAEPAVGSGVVATAEQCLGGRHRQHGVTGELRPRLEQWEVGPLDRSRLEGGTD